MKSTMRDFIESKKIEGKSEQSIKYYTFVLGKFITFIGEDRKITSITTADIRQFLINYNSTRNINATTLDNMRRVLSSFFGWTMNNGYLSYNPSAAVMKVKVSKVQKEGFSDEELDKIREHCKNKRDRAMVEVLYSSGMRISELLSLNKKDINWETQSCKVIGKGDKERVVYFSVPATRRLREYLNSRTDDNEALFVGLRAPHNRLKKNSAEAALRKIGEKINVHVYPHRFRHTFATHLLNKGMPIEEVSKLLGHEKLETTQIYCTVNAELTAINYKRMI